MHPLSNTELEEYYKGTPLFLGVYPKNRIPPALAARKRGSLIVNMNDAGQSGSHWTLILLEPEHTVYFDPFGVLPSNEVRAFIKKRNKQGFYVDRQLQDLKSTSCGWWCVHFINECMVKKRHIMDVMGDFTYDTRENERLLQSAFEK